MSFLTPRWQNNSKGDVLRNPAQWDYFEVTAQDGNGYPTTTDFYAGGSGGKKVFSWTQTWDALGNELTFDLSIFPDNMVDPNL